MLFKTTGVQTLLTVHAVSHMTAQTRMLEPFVSLEIHTVLQLCTWVHACVIGPWCKPLLVMSGHDRYQMVVAAQPTCSIQLRRHVLGLQPHGRITQLIGLH